MNQIDAALLSKMFLAGAKNLEVNKEYINELNVFPVPDGDTGTNMSMTIMSAANEVSAIADLNMATLSKAISSGSLRGARGNSGVILSQLLRGFTKVIKTTDTFDVKTCSEAFNKAVETAYKAVMKPKEGTILTVARCTAERAAEVAETTDDFEVFAKEIMVAADKALQNTPNLLPVLKEAGVVDSGGTGLLEFLKGAQAAMLGMEIELPEVSVSAEPAQTTAAEVSEEEIKFGYCTEFIVVLNKPVSDSDAMKFRDYIEGIGDSVVFVPDEEIIKVHVHTNDPGLALQKALKFGALSRIKIDNMREEHQERLALAAQKAAEAVEAVEPTQESASEEVPVEETIPEIPAIDPADYKEYGFVSVSAGDGLSQIFTDLGVDQVITGGQTMNPSTEDIVNAINAVPARNVFVLPNNKNIILASEQSVYLVEDKNVIIIPTTTVPQGITAVISFMEDSSPEENKEHMIEEISHVKTGQVTYAVRDTSIEGIEIHNGQIMAIGDGGLLGVGETQAEVVASMMEKLVDEESEIISIYYGEGISEEDAQAIADNVSETYPDCEVEVYLGGQPVYYYIVSVE